MNGILIYVGLQRKEWRDLYRKSTSLERAIGSLKRLSLLESLISFKCVQDTTQHLHRRLFFAFHRLSVRV